MILKSILLICTLILAVLPVSAAEQFRVIPEPAQISFSQGFLVIDPFFRISLNRDDTLLRNAAARLARNLSAKTGLKFAVAPVPEGQAATLRVLCDAADPHFLTPQADESYTLRVTTAGAELCARGPAGVLRGMATFLQLVQIDSAGFRAPAVEIKDQPRFAWRGLMLDVARHFLTVETLKRNLDAMELVKMNVLELHFSDAEGFRLESKVYPRLQAMGSGGQYYTQKEIRELVDYARERGIRVVPEIEMPGHSKAMLVAYPHLAALPGPYALGADHNNTIATVDPTREEVYHFLDRLLGEIGALFPDPYFHAGGDEVNGTQWSRNSRIQAFMNQRGLRDKHELQGYFTERVRKILSKHGKTMIGWDEVLQPNLAKDILIQAWRSSKMVERSAAEGHTTLVSAGYYLDHGLTAAAYYAVDPFDSRADGLPPEALKLVKGTPFAGYVSEDNVAVDSPPLTPEEDKLVAGGIACMWSEFVWDEKEEIMVWPRVAAIAERLWSPGDVKDADSLYRRMAALDADLARLGLRQHTNETLMLERLAGDHSVLPLATLAETVEPLKNLARLKPRLEAAMASGKAMDNTVVTTRFVDALPAESLVAWNFRALVHQMLAAGRGPEELRRQVRAQLARWRDNDSQFQAIARDSSMLQEVIPASQDLKDLAEAGLEALTMWESKHPPNAAWVEKQKALVARHRKVAEASTNLLVAMMSPQPRHELMNVIAPAIEELVNAAGAAD
ncbi:MAG: family 20 glycosylhydrolase [Terriglobia bacterium]|jgi:hexosaminidase